MAANDFKVEMKLDYPPLSQKLDEYFLGPDAGAVEAQVVDECYCGDSSESEVQPPRSLDPVNGKNDSVAGPSAVTLESKYVGKNDITAEASSMALEFGGKKNESFGVAPSEEWTTPINHDRTKKKVLRRRRRRVRPAIPDPGLDLEPETTAEVLRKKPRKREVWTREDAILAKHVMYAELDSRILEMEKAGPCPWQSGQDKNKGGILPFSVPFLILVAILSFIVGVIIREMVVANRIPRIGYQNSTQDGEELN